MEWLYSDFGIEEKKGEKTEKEKDFLDILKMFAPGTSLRGALDDLLNARMGALIVFENDKIEEIAEKGFRINSKFSSQKLVELCKMDGAIILSGDGKKILYANALLYPSLLITTKETGTRHKAAERTAKQANTLVIAVSERKNKISIYYGEMKYELEKSSEILRRASETLHVLEKQRELYNDSILNFNILEINNLVTIIDVCGVLQRLEIINRISQMVKSYLIELGKEGMVVSMRLRELTRNIQRDETFLLRDYFQQNYLVTREKLKKMDFDDLLEVSNIAKGLFEDVHDNSLDSTGLRILSKTTLSEKHLTSLISKYKNLDNILSLDNEQLLEALGNEEIFVSFTQELTNLKEKIMLGKNI